MAGFELFSFVILAGLFLSCDASVGGCIWLYKTLVTKQCGG